VPNYAPTLGGRDLGLFSHLSAINYLKFQKFLADSKLFDATV
jgi:hypothetical protein